MAYTPRSYQPRRSYRPEPETRSLDRLIIRFCLVLVKWLVGLAKEACDCGPDQVKIPWRWLAAIVVLALFVNWIV